MNVKPIRLYCGLLMISALVCACILSGCGDGSADFDDFRAKVQEAAGAGAVDCGVAEIGDFSQTNCCVEDNYSKALPVYAIYKFQGIDSDVAAGVSCRASGRVTHLHFDSFGNGRITKEACSRPQLRANACSDSENLPFECGL